MYLNIMLQHTSCIFFILPFACALVCWLFACVLIHYLFSPQQPIKIAGTRLQGFLPAKQEYIINAIAGKTEQILLQHKEQAAQNIISPENVEKIMPEMEKHIDEFLTVKLPKDIPMLSMFIGEKTIHQIKEVFMKELRVLFPNILSAYLDKMLKPGNIQNYLTENISTTSITAASTAFKRCLRPSFIKIKLLACVFGLLAGSLLSVVIFSFT